MEKNQYKLCLEVLRRLEKEGVLKDIILIGSWCLPFYKDYFSKIGYFPLIRTRDIDLLIPSPSKFSTRVDLPSLLKDLGFIVRHYGSKGYIKLEHADLIIEFLSPEKGRGTDEPIIVSKLGVNAEALRYLNILIDHSITANIEGIKVHLPHPVYFSFHKLIVFQQRSNKDKAQKDQEAALMLLRALDSKGERPLIKSAFKSLLPSWRTRILKGLQGTEEAKYLQKD